MARNSDTPIHYEVRPGVARPLCNARSVPARNITPYKGAVTCPDCNLKMR